MKILQCFVFPQNIVPISPWRNFQLHCWDNDIRTSELLVDYNATIEIVDGVEFVVFENDIDHTMFLLRWS